RVSRPPLYRRGHGRLSGGERANRSAATANSNRFGNSDGLMMLRYFFSRLLYMLPVVWLVVSVVFLLIHLVPGDPIQQMLGEGAAATDIAAARHAYGLDAPLG